MKYSEKIDSFLDTISEDKKEIDRQLTNLSKVVADPEFKFISDSLQIYILSMLKKLASCSSFMDDIVQFQNKNKG